VDVRLIAASNDSLDDSISKGTFREDLYYRLAEFVISLPPLRGRREDILPLAQAFLSEATVELKRPASVITEPAAALLHEYNWPGNIRQLRNVMRRVALQTTSVSIEPDDLRPLLGPVFHSSVEPVAAAVQASSGPAPAVPINAVSNGHSSLGDTSVGDRSLKDIGRIAIEAAEKQAIMEALSRTYGNKQKAAQLLRTDYKTLFVKLKRYGLGNAHTKIN
jgi:DNA-binding NtrC family response regulator